MRSYFYVHTQMVSIACCILSGYINASKLNLQTTKYSCHLVFAHYYELLILQTCVTFI